VFSKEVILKQCVLPDTLYCSPLQKTLVKIVLTGQFERLSSYFCWVASCTNDTTNVSPYGIWLSQSNSNSKRLAPICWSIFSFIDDTYCLLILVASLLDWCILLLELLSPVTVQILLQIHCCNCNRPSKKVHWTHMGWEQFRVCIFPGLLHNVQCGDIGVQKKDCHSSHQTY